MFCDQQTVSVPGGVGQELHRRLLLFLVGVAAVIAMPEPPVQQPKPAGPSGRNAVPDLELGRGLVARQAGGRVEIRQRRARS